jgi:AcrR family transcriptional regulator
VSARQPRTGRRAGDSGTRAAILAAARQEFADRGYDGATIRAIAAGAGVDPALVHHFYGTKERLFAAAMRMPFVPSEVITAALAEHGGPSGTADPPRSLGEHMVRTALTVWENTEVRGVFLGLLRSAVTSEDAAAMLREFIADAILRPISAAAQAGAGAGPDGGDQADIAYRASVVATQMLGLALSRYVIKLEPVASADPADLAATIGPTLDRYLTGPIRRP